MKKTFLLLSLLCCIQISAFEAKIIITRALNIEEQFRHILPQRPPFFPVLSKVEPHAPFKVYFICLHPEVKNNQAALSGNVTFNRADGKKQQISLKPVKFNISGDKAGVILIPGNITIVMDKPPKDPYGKYSVELELKDNNSNKTVKTSAAFEYVSELKPQKNTDPLQKLLNYYREPEPEYILSGFEALIKKQPEQKKKEGKNYNPLPQMALFYYLLKNNPQCVDPFAEMVINQMGIDGRNLGSTILYFLSPQTAKMLPDEFQEHCRKHFKTNPFEIKNPTLPYQLDILWSEFFVTGQKEPLMKVINAVSLFNDSISINDFKKLKNPTAQDRKKLFNGLTAYTATWSANSLSKQHSLINFYLESALVRKELKDKLAAAAAAKILQDNSKKK